MSREFKFRAWNGEKLIYKVTPSVFPQVYTESKLEVCAEITDYEPEYFDQVNFIAVECIEQYTGLKDKNGKEIYEGDIISFENDNEIAMILWLDGQAMFGLRWLGCRVEDELDYWNVCKGPVEVIGNIHENPELIENT